MHKVFIVIDFVWIDMRVVIKYLFSSDKDRILDWGCEVLNKSVHVLFWDTFMLFRRWTMLIQALISCETSLNLIDKPWDLMIKFHFWSLTNSL